MLENGVFNRAVLRWDAKSTPDKTEVSALGTVSVCLAEALIHSSINWKISKEKKEKTMNVTEREGK